MDAASGDASAGAVPMAAAPPPEATVAAALAMAERRYLERRVGVAARGGPWPAVKVAKKRGRPSKYGPDGSLIRQLNATPMPSAAAVG
jgi:hypothetical protein